MSNKVTYGRTVSKNYQSKKFEITLEVYEGWNIADVAFLAQAIVSSAVGERMSRRYRRDAESLCEEYFGDGVTLANFVLDD